MGLSSRQKLDIVGARLSQWEGERYAHELNLLSQRAADADAAAVQATEDAINKLDLMIAVLEDEAANLRSQVAIEEGASVEAARTVGGARVGAPNRAAKRATARRPATKKSA